MPGAVVRNEGTVELSQVVDFERSTLTVTEKPPRLRNPNVRKVLRLRPIRLRNWFGAFPAGQRLFSTINHDSASEVKRGSQSPSLPAIVRKRSERFRQGFGFVRWPVIFK